MMSENENVLSAIE